jgi:hypothetical protein
MVMKKILLLIFILLTDILINAQPFGSASKNYRIKKQDYKNSNGELGYTIFRYNNEGKLSGSLWTLVDSSRFSNNFYAHDSSGNLVSSLREFNDGITSTELFVYDKTGNKVKEQLFRSDGIKGKAFYQYENNLLKTAVLENFKGWLTCVINYQYNNKNQLTNGIISRSGNTIGRIEFTNDSNGNLIQEYWDFNGKWNQTFTYAYEKKNLTKYFYSSPFLQSAGGLRIKSEHYNYNNEKGGPSDYFYNEEGLLYKKTFTRNDGFITNTFYRNDNQRRLISSERIYSEGDTAKFSYTYDEHDNLIVRCGVRSDTLMSFESYLYNSDGELTKAYYYNFDNWLTGILTFKSDLKGCLQSCDFKGHNGFDASINFKYNSQGNLSGIKWDFSFGKFQEYLFEYEPTNMQ